LEAASGSEAISIAREHLPDVILMDLRLPDQDGAGVARRLGDDALTAAIPVVVLSSSRPAGGREWLRKAGFAGYLEKPISVSEFADQVRSYCGGAAA
jgi:two-component system, cell cycle response regulator DivK